MKFVISILILITILSFKTTDKKTVSGNFAIESNQNICSDMILRRVFALNYEKNTLDYYTIFSMPSNDPYLVLGLESIENIPLDTLYTNKGTYLLYKLQLDVVDLGCRRIDFRCKRRKSFVYEVTNCKVL